MSDQAVYDAVVVGAGIIGSSTAYYLAKNGHRTLLLEQVGLAYDVSCNIAARIRSSQAIGWHDA